MTEPEEPDLEGWDRERDGWMRDYDIPVGADIEPWDPAKDPVLNGKVRNPYEPEVNDAD